MTKNRMMISKLVEHFKQEWKSLEGNNTYKVHAFMSVVVDKKRNYYKVISSVSDGESYGNALLKGPHKRKFVKLNDNKSLLVKAGFKRIPIFYSIGNNSEVVHKPNLEEFASFTTTGRNKHFGYTFTRVEKLKFKDENIESFFDE